MAFFVSYSKETTTVFVPVQATLDGPLKVTTSGLPVALPVEVTFWVLVTVWLWPVAEIVSLCGPGQTYGKFIVPLPGG